MKIAVTWQDKKNIKPLLQSGTSIFIVGLAPLAHRMKHPVDLDALPGVIDQIHQAGKSIWVNVNALLHEPQLDEAKRAIETLSTLNIDGLLFADLAVFNFADAVGLKDKLIYYPETYTTSDHDVRFWNDEGIQSLIVGREMTLNDIEAMAKTQSLPLSIVGHGYLNMFHSRRPLVENFFKHTNDQNPDDVKDKRSLTLVEEQRNEAYPIYQDAFGTHIFRAKPLASFKVLDKLKVWIDTLIIDGLFFDDVHVLSMINDYEQALRGEAVEGYKDYDDGFYFKKTGLNKGVKS